VGWSAQQERGAGGYGAALGEVRAAFAALEPAKETKPMPLAELAPAPHAALVDYVVDDDRTTVIVLTARGRLSTVIPIARAELRARVFDLREALGSPERDPVPLATALYDRLVAPIAERLRSDDVTTLWVSAEDVLRYLPLAALYDGRRYFGERYAIASVSPVAPAERTHAPKTVAAVRRVTARGRLSRAARDRGAAGSRHACVRARTTNAASCVCGQDLAQRSVRSPGLRDALGSNYDIVHVASHFQFTPGNETDSLRCSAPASTCRSRAAHRRVSARSRRSAHDVGV
jgi:CHAT domain-containing protein